MVGMGLVTTSSPTSPRTGRPAVSKASTATPSARQEISPGPNWSRTQVNDCAGTGDPVAPSCRRAGLGSGVTPRRSQACR
jgi:hypothetical protein